MRSDKCWPNVVLVCICKDTQPMQNYAKKKRKEKKVVAFASIFYPPIFYCIIFNTIFTVILQRMLGSFIRY